MKGIVALEKPELWPGGDPIEFSLQDVTAFGKIWRHGDFVKRFIVRLMDGRTVFVKSYEQSEDEQRLLSRWATRMAQRDPMSGGRPPRLSRDNPTVVEWIDVVVAKETSS